MSEHQLSAAIIRRMSELPAELQHGVLAPAAAPLDPEDFNPPTPRLAASLRMVFEDANPANIPPARVAEAREHLDRVLALLRPATPNLVWAWIKALGGARLYDAPKVTDVEACTKAIWETCSGLCAGVWTDATRLTFQQTHDRWPAPARLMKFLGPYHQTLLRQRRLCQTLISAAAAAEAEKERLASIVDERECPIAQERVSELVRSLRVSPTGNSANPIIRANSPVERVARTLATPALLASYEKDAEENPNPTLRAASKRRAEVLRRALLDRETEENQ